MALFRRTKKDSVLPEVDKYYEAERRDRAGLAWLLALISIGVVALVIIGAFLGGRWAYRQITKDDNETVSLNDSNNNSDAPSFDGTPENSQDNATDNSDESTQAPADNGNSEATPQTNTPSTTPATGDANTNLPKTGPEHVAAVFLVTAIAAGGAHQLIERRKAIRS